MGTNASKMGWAITTMVVVLCLAVAGCKGSKEATTEGAKTAQVQAPEKVSAGETIAKSVGGRAYLLMESKEQLAVRCRDNKDAAACKEAAEQYHVWLTDQPGGRPQTTPADKATALDLWTRACDLGDQSACKQIPSKQPIPTEAADAAGQSPEEKCDGGDGDACYQLFKSRKSRNDTPLKTLQLLLKGCRGGSGLACFSYASIIADSAPDEAKEDFRKADRLLRTACDAGSGDSCWGIALMLQSRVAKGQAGEWQRLAQKGCDLGSEGACKLAPAAGSPTDTVPRRLDSNDDRSASQLGNDCFTNIKAGDFANAEAECELGLSRTVDPRVTGALLFNLGLIAEKRGLPKEARPYFMRSLEVRGENAVVRRHLQSLPPD